MKNKPAGIILLSVFLALIGFAVARSQPPTNEEVVVSAVKDQVEKNFGSDSVPALLVISGEKELELLVGGGIADAMRDKYPQVLLSSAPAPNADNLTFNIEGFDFSFHKGASRGFLKTHKINRRLQEQLRITIRNGIDGQVREMKELSISYSDTIDPAWAKYVSSPNIVELSPSAPVSSWSRYVEPGLVIAAVGALVYLFFANR
jgi:hypothetical protein